MRGVMVDLLGKHGAHDTNVVGDAADVRKQLAYLLSRFAELLEAILRTETDERFALQLRDLLPLGERFRHLLLMHLGEFGFVVKRLQMRWAARLIEEDDPLRLGSMMQRIDYTAPAPG